MALGEATSDPWVLSSTCPALSLHLTSSLPSLSSGSPPSGCFFSSYFLATLPLLPVLNVGAPTALSAWTTLPGGELSHHDHRGDVQTCTPALASLLTHRANRLLVSWCLCWDTLLAPQTQHVRIGTPNETSSWAAHLGDITVSRQPGVRQTTVPFQVLAQMPPPFDSPGSLRCPFSYGPSGAYTGTMKLLRVPWSHRCGQTSSVAADARGELPHHAVCRHHLGHTPGLVHTGALMVYTADCW
ncbi:uncharacterized protein LOC132367372 isoform X3 [Balaenoptera ricei]|uniref:uncharacterized protein LOC132367372 isoform X3 n=1 Tax=Balaenoptera ricei TaxID=2746895 RepID=UPI0028BD3F6C|nr:uncharacterized protein LOC132367372 isoform X3 [Balaenoptera ricei]